MNADEHEILNDSLVFMCNSYDNVIHDMPKDCESYARYEALKKLMDRSFDLWKERFE